MTDRPADNQPITSAQEAYDGLQNVSPETPCPYLPGRLFRSEAYLADALDGGVYESLMAVGFRRSGRIVYRPRCRGCRECHQLRVPVEPFRPTKSMRRVMRLNDDVRVEVGEPVPTDEKHDVYRRYLDDQHDGSMSRDYESFVSFLYDSPIEAREFRYYLGTRLVGVGIADVCPNGLSSVYMYFDPDYRKRSLGTFSAVWEVGHCRREGLSYYYFGYYVASCSAMSYKARFRPNEVLVGSDRWICFRD